MRAHADTRGIALLHCFAQLRIQARRVLLKKTRHIREEFFVAAKPGERAYRIQDAARRYAFCSHALTAYARMTLRGRRRIHFYDNRRPLILQPDSSSRGRHRKTPAAGSTWGFQV